MFKRNDLKTYIKSIIDQGPQLSQTPYLSAWNARRALNVATAEFKELYQNKAAKLEETYATSDNRDWDWYQKDMTETKEISRDDMSQQAHKSGNATPIDNGGLGNVAQPPNNSSSNSQILMMQLPTNNSWAQEVMFILQQML